MFEFRLDRTGTAHVTHPNMVLALCAARTRGPAGTHGRPCARCLALAAQEIANRPELDPSVTTK